MNAGNFVQYCDIKIAVISDIVYDCKELAVVMKEIW